MIQHKDLMELPFQFWLGLLCYCCKTQSTSILPVLLSLPVVEDAHTTYPGVYIRTILLTLSLTSPHLFLLWMDWSLSPNLPPLFEGLLVTMTWMLQSVQRVILSALYKLCVNFRITLSYLHMVSQSPNFSLLLLPPQVLWCYLLPGWTSQALPSLTFYIMLAMFLHQSSSLTWLEEHS